MLDKQYTVLNMKRASIPDFNLYNEQSTYFYMSIFDTINNSIILTDGSNYYLFLLNLYDDTQTGFYKNIFYIKDVAKKNEVESLKTF